MKLELVNRLRRLSAAGWSSAMSDMNPDESARIKTAQSAHVANITNTAILAYLLNAVVMVVYFHKTAIGPVVFAWGCLLCAVLACMAISMRYYWRMLARQDREESKSARYYVDAAIRVCMLIGCFWGSAAIIVIPGATGTMELTAGGILLMGSMFGGVLLYGQVPKAAMGVVIPIALGILIGLQLQQDARTGLLLMIILVYTVLLFFATQFMFTQFAEQNLTQRSLEEQADLIGLLLNDFEETTSDWLWQTDASGIIRSHRDNAAQAHLDTGTRMPEGGYLPDLFVPSVGRDTLDKALEHKQPFRDLVLERARPADGDTQWWSFSGKPVFQKGRFQGFRGVAADVTQSKIAEDRIDFMAHHDSLTGLANREALTEALDALGKHAARTGDHALIRLDPSNLKWVNDTMGHHAGDQVLQQLAERMRQQAGKGGVAARINGDEFALIVPCEAHDMLTNRLDEMCADFARPYQIRGSSAHCPATLGVKILPTGAFSPEAVLRHADMALYSAKSKRKGGWVAFSQSLEDDAQSIYQLETDLNQTIERDEFRLFFQPVIDARSRQVVGCEVLLRWLHPGRGLLSPDVFIPLAEDTGIVLRIGNWVIREALKQARRLPDHVRVAINISPLQLHNDKLIPVIADALVVNNIEPSRLEVEITESVLMTDSDHTLGILRQLKDIGVRIVLDDFGTGFSSLNYLRQFPFDKLKIDKSFIGNLETSADNRAIIKAILQLATILGMRCTGEGVETPQQEQFLRDNGCDELQGYIISHPGLLEDLGHLIAFRAEAENARQEAEQSARATKSAKKEPGSEQAAPKRNRIA